MEKSTFGSILSRVLSVSSAILLFGSIACSDDNTSNGGGTSGLLSVSEDIVPVDGSGITNYRVDITTDDPWEAEFLKTEDWVSMIKREDHILINVLPNPTKELRESTIEVTTAFKTATIDIYQNRRTASVLDVSGDLGFLIMDMSPSGKYLLVMNSSEEYFVWDWDNDDYISLEGGTGIRITDEPLVAGIYQSRAAYWVDGTWNHFITADHVASEVTGISRDGNFLAGFYNVPTGYEDMERIIFNYDVSTGQISALEGSEWEMVIYPRFVSDDGKIVVGDHASFGFFWFDGKITDDLSGDMYLEVHVVDTIHALGHIRDFTDRVRFPSDPYMSPNGKYIAGTIWEKDHRTYNDGESYVIGSGWSYKTYIYNTESQQVWYPGTDGISSIMLNVKDDGMVYSSLYIYDFNNQTVSSMADKMMEEFDVDIDDVIEWSSNPGYVNAISDDWSKVAWGQAYGVGNRSWLFHLDY